MDKQPVAIFWDYENCHAPASISGYELAESIRNVAHQHGPVKVFKAYMEISEQTSSRGLALRSELQTSGVSLTDCPHSGRKDVADKMMMVDMLAHAIDNPGPYTFILISGDRDFAYAAAILRLRQYRVVVISPTLPAAHASLKSQASLCLDWTIDIMSKVAGAVISPQHVRRESTPASAAAKPIEPVIVPEKPQTPPKVDASVQFPDSSVTTRPCPDSTPAPRYTPTAEPVLGRSPSGHRHSKSISAMTSGGLSGQTIMSYGPSYAPNTNLPPASSVSAQYPSTAAGFIRLPPIDLQGNVTWPSVPSMLGLNGASSSRPFSNVPVRSHPPQPIPSKPTTPIVSSLSQPKPVFSSLNYGSSSPIVPVSQASQMMAVSRSSSPVVPLSKPPERPTSAPAASQSPRALPPYFVTLVKLLAECESKGIERPHWKEIVAMLGPYDLVQVLFRQAGVHGFKGFSLLAEKAGIVILGGQDGQEWMTLAPDWDQRLHLPDGLNTWTSVPVAAGTAHIPEVVAPRPIPAIPASSLTSPKPPSLDSWQPKVMKPKSPITKSILPQLSHSVVNPQASTSALPPQSQVIKSLPQCFLPLVTLLQDLKNKGVRQPHRGTVAVMLGDQRVIQALYKQANVQSFREYSLLAEKAGIVVMGGEQGGAWISLSESWTQNISLPSLSERNPASGSSASVPSYSSSPAPPVAATPLMSHNPPSASTSSAVPQSQSKPVPPHFLPLVKALEESKVKGIIRPLRGTIAYALGKDQRALQALYKQAGVQQFKGYSSLAEKIGLVTMGGKDGKDWISLNPNYGKGP
ncbi:NYN domain-containing protein [Mycena floridula]|nr:NYN domain-containing protein [Mycena floridula]